MEAKKYLYAAVGAQVAVAKGAQAKIDELVGKFAEASTTVSTDLRKRVDEWAGEGETFLGKVTDTKAIDDLTSKVDLEQVQTQVNKLRDQLEDIVSTWRSNFRPEAAAPTAEKVVVEAPAEKTEAKKPAPSKASTTKSTPAKSTAAKKNTAAKKPAASKAS